MSAKQPRTILHDANPTGGNGVTHDVGPNGTRVRLTSALGLTEAQLQVSDDGTDWSNETVITEDRTSPFIIGTKNTGMRCRVVLSNPDGTPVTITAADH